MTPEKLDELEKTISEGLTALNKIALLAGHVVEAERYTAEDAVRDLQAIRRHLPAARAAINALPELLEAARRVRELEARVQELENAGSEMVDWAEHARIFVGSREKMHPDGQSFYDQARGNLYAAITRQALKGTP